MLSNIRALSQADFRRCIAFFPTELDRRVFPDLPDRVHAVIVDQRDPFPLPFPDEKEIVGTDVQMQIPGFMKYLQDLQRAAHDPDDPQKSQRRLQRSRFRISFRRRTRIRIRIRFRI